MWLAFCFAVPFPHCVFPSIPSILLTFSPILPAITSFQRFLNSCKYSGDTIANTRWIVSCDGIPLGYSKCLRRNFSLATAKQYIPTHSSAFASDAKNTIAIISFIKCFTFFSYLISTTTDSHCIILFIFSSPLG